MRTRSNSKPDGTRLHIALVSDFFCPNTGGVETHIYYLAHHLLARGHKVIVLTHAYGDRRGIRLLSNRLKVPRFPRVLNASRLPVYYLPFIVAYNGCSLATITGSLPWYRWIFLRERISLVHGHSTFSSMAHEAMLHAGCLGIRTCFTDHSLFGFADASAILTNHLVLRYSLANVDRVICVSHTSKENTVLRAGLRASKVYVIPNAIDTHLFTPSSSRVVDAPITVIVLSRLVYRKGADLLVEVLPEICRRHPTLRVLIGGDGPKRVALEEMRERFALQDRISMRGELPHNEVRDFFIQGQIFLNTSLTEAFCMSIVEAAACGLHVVSTRVGGIPEVLPEELVTFAEPTPQCESRSSFHKPIPALIAALDSAICAQRDGLGLTVEQRHEAVTHMYSWSDVVERTLVVYDSAMAEPLASWTERLKRYYYCGIGFGILYIWVSLINMIWITAMDLWDPREIRFAEDVDNVAITTSKKKTKKI